MLASLALLAAATVPCVATAQTVADPANPVRALYVGEDPLVRSQITVSDLTGRDGGVGGYPGGSGFGSSVTPVNPPVGQDNARYATPYGSGFDGVARLLMKNGAGVVQSGCTGTLLWTGLDILTAAHCVSNGTGLTTAGIDVGFLNSGGTVTTISSSAIYVKPGYDGAVVQPNDLAIVRLSAPAESWMTRYSLFTGDPLWREITVAGYGRTGSGLTGAIASQQFNDVPVRRQAKNQFDFYRGAAGCGNAGFIFTGPACPILDMDFDGARPGGTYPTRGGNWAAQDFDTNNSGCRAWGVSPLTPVGSYNPAGLSDEQIAAICSTTYGINEGLTGSGDSGGPAFASVNGQYQVAGVASFGGQRCVPSQATPAATDAGCPAGFILNGSYFGARSGHVAVGFGENAAWINATVVPEPSTVTLAAAGLAGLAAAARRRRQGHSA